MFRRVVTCASRQMTRGAKSSPHTELNNQACKQLHTIVNKGKVGGSNMGKGMNIANRRNLSGEVEPKSPYPSQAYLFGREPGAPLEGWEGIYLIVMGSCTLLLVFGYGNTQRESFREWARREALARERVIEDGGELEFGKFYSSKEGYAVESIDVMPVKGGDEE